MVADSKGRPTLYKDRTEVKFYCEQEFKRRLAEAARKSKPPVSVSQFIQNILEKLI